MPIIEPIKKVEGDEGVTHLFSGAFNLTVLGEGKVFIRNGLRINAPPGTPDKVRWLVGELNGVRVYIDGDNAILTTRDLYP